MPSLKTQCNRVASAFLEVGDVVECVRISRVALPTAAKIGERFTISDKGQSMFADYKFLNFKEINLGHWPTSFKKINNV